MRIAVLFYAILLLAGCAATLHDVRQSPPTLTISSDLPAKTLANKITYESVQEKSKSPMFPDWDPAKTIELENGVHKILVTFTRTLCPPRIVAELTIIPAESGGSLIEYRGIPWVSQDKFLVMVKQCASPTEKAPAP